MVYMLDKWLLNGGKSHPFLEGWSIGSVITTLLCFTTRTAAVTDVFDSGRNEEPYALDVV